MGKYDNRNKLIESGRLTGLKSMPNSGNRFDARQKLMQKSLSASSARNATGFISKQNLKQQKIDARQLLLNKQQKQIQKEKIKQILLDKQNRQKYIEEAEDDDEIIFKKSNTRQKGKSEPLVIVTGLGNVRKQGDRIQVIGNKKPLSNSSNSSHKVIVDGVNTLVTLRNKISSSNRLASDYDDEGYNIDQDNDAIDIDKSSNFKQIRIRIDNDLKQASSSNLNHNSSISSKHKSNYEMEWSDDNQSSHLSSKFNSRINSANNSDYSKSSSANVNAFGNNGYKLLVSNLHPRVTEDDVLELFSDIGPIKRARFLEKGIAEVVYVKLEHAEEAIYKYNRNELDGRPMKIELAEKYDSKSLFPQLQAVSNTQSTSFNASSSSPFKSNIGSSSSHTTSSSSRHNHLLQQQHPQQLQSSASSSMSSMSFYKAKADLAEEASSFHQSSAKNTLSNRFKSATNTSTFNLPEPVSTTYGKKGGFDTSNKVSAVDTSIIQQVLFNKKGTTSSNPVTFTVKL